MRGKVQAHIEGKRLWIRFIYVSVKDEQRLGLKTVLHSLLRGRLQTIPAHNIAFQVLAQLRITRAYYISYLEAFVKLSTTSSKANTPAYPDLKASSTLQNSPLATGQVKGSLKPAALRDRAPAPYGAELLYAATSP